MSRWRSLLFVPTDSSDRSARAARKGADALILDLEDGVSQVAKTTARAALPALASRLSSAGAKLLIRVNGGWRAALADLEVAVRHDVAALVVPKCEEPDRLGALAEIMSELESERGLTERSIALVALVETPLGLARASELAMAPRVLALAFGSEDFSLSLGVRPTAEALDLPCQQLSLAAAARGLQCLAMPFSIASIRDLEGFRSAANRARAIGCTGALCVHPDQVAIANTCFGPTKEERTAAHRIVMAWDSEVRAHRSVIEVDGVMVDLPVVERARRVLGRAQCK
jgi:citrate lyase subunit beta/citryl-CoA lyase